MLRPLVTSSTHLFKHQTHTVAPNFQLLSWNVAKRTDSKAFEAYFSHLIQKEKIDFFLLQEIAFNPHSHAFLKDFSYAFAANLQTRSQKYGVLSAFKSHCHFHQNYLTDTKELHWFTHKSALLSEHPIDQDTDLTLLNLHAINFVSFTRFKRELDQILDLLEDKEGPVILAGDFNTWNKKRYRYLEKKTQFLGLQKAQFEDARHLKRFLKYPLDHLFYKGLKYHNARVLDASEFSDHNPLVISFSYKP